MTELLKVHSEYPPLSISSLQLGVTCTHYLEFFSCPAQLRNYFHYALPAELSPKLHVSCCGKYMTFGDATSWENNERHCTWCQCLQFWQNRRGWGVIQLITEHLLCCAWSAFKQPLIPCGRGLYPKCTIFMKRIYTDRHTNSISKTCYYWVLIVEFIYK